MQFLVTVKLPRNPEHDPTRKRRGICPVSGGPCSDITGQHHTVLIEAESVGEAQRLSPVEHVTRIEVIG